MARKAILTEEQQTVPLNFRVPKELKEELEEMAKKEDRTLSNLVLTIIKRGVKNAKRRV